MNIADIQWADIPRSKPGAAMCKQLFDVSVEDLQDNYGAVIAGFDVKKNMLYPESACFNSSGHGGHQNNAV